VVIGHINGVAGRTKFSFKKMYGHFARTKIIGCDNRVTVLMR